VLVPVEDSRKGFSAMTISEEQATTSRLCAACGMCCDGTLFHGMRLQTGDVSRRLAALGLRAKHGLIAQPCPAHQGACCTIYADRPVRCREFSCRQLLAVHAGTRTAPEALATIAEARILREQVRTLLRDGGDAREHKPRATRQAAVFTPPLDPSPEAEKARAGLRGAMEKLETHLTQYFRTATDQTGEEI